MLFPNIVRGFFSEFQFCIIIKYTCFQQLGENPHSFSVLNSHELGFCFFSLLYILSHAKG